MTPGRPPLRWRLLVAAIDQSLALPVEARAAYLRDTCELLGYDPADLAARAQVRLERLN